MQPADVRSVDPRTGEKVERVTVATDPADVDGIVRAAAVAAPALAADRAARAQLLEAMAAELEADRDKILPIVDRESGLGLGRLTGEFARTCMQLRLFADVVRDGGYLDVRIDLPDPNAVPAPRPDLRLIKVPIGAVAVFSASNFPLAFSVAGGDTASALAAGCPVVVKAHSDHPATSEAVVAPLRRAAAAAGMPDVIAVVHGRPAAVALIEHPLINAVGFTGSLAGGRALFDRCARRDRPIPFYGELGSVNPMVVTPAAAAERAHDIGVGLAASVTNGVGQLCTKPGLVLLPAGEAGERLEQALAAAVATGPGGAGGPMLDGGIRDAFTDGASRRGELPGVRVLLSARPGPGFSATPGVVAVPASALLAGGSARDSGGSARDGGGSAGDGGGNAGGGGGGADGLGLLLEECFGPFTVCVRYESEDELFAVVDLVPGSLTGTVHSASGETAPGTLAARVADRLAGRVGRVIWNGYPTGVAVTWAMQHGGPYPSSTAAGTTSVGTAAIDRWLRPVAFQSAPPATLPPELQDSNPLAIPRRVNGHLEGPPLSSLS